MRNWVTLLVLFGVVGFFVAGIVEQRDTLSTQISAAAEDLGCKPIEQSYNYPEKFYVDCGKGGIQIITVGK